jgi:adenine phosphoribosyltransferase
VPFRPLRSRATVPMIDQPTQPGDGAPLARLEADPGIDIKSHIRGIPDFPKPGILFYDISTLLRHGPAWRAAMARMAAQIAPYKPDILAGIESRGFLVAAPLALELGLGFVMLRKPRKLPGLTIGLNYALEYGTDRIEMQADAVPAGKRVVVLDDLLATGGTMSAGISLLRQAGAIVPCAACLIELSFLKGRERLDVPFEALVSYDA